VCTRSVLSVGWPLGDIQLLCRSLQWVSRGSLVQISSGSGLLWGQQANFSSVLLFLRFCRFRRVMSVFRVIRLFELLRYTYTRE
jgi:hypothetical protein